jgi:glycerophosphoryl diester phosphodiesterase
MRADMIELDVQLTEDRRAVIFHDDRLERTTTGQGRLAQQPYRNLQRLDAGSWFGTPFAGERMLLASQALAMVRPPCRINLELKRTSPDRVKALADCVCRVVRRTRNVRRVLVSSFDPHLIARVKTRLPRAAIALISRRAPAQALRRAAQLGCSSWHPHRTSIKPSLIQQAHGAGLRVHVWTVDRPLDATRLLRMGVDGLFTNVPDRIRSTIRRAVT